MRARLWLQFLVTLSLLMGVAIATAEAPTTDPPPATVTPVPNVFTYQG